MQTATTSVARVGGDEFAIIQTNPGNEERIKKFAKRILLLLQKPIQEKEFKFHIDATIGISLYTQEIENGEQFLRSATIALHEAKDWLSPLCFIIRIQTRNYMKILSLKMNCVNRLMQMSLCFTISHK